jgi:hypothetical protein
MYNVGQKQEAMGFLELTNIAVITVNRDEFLPNFVWGYRVPLDTLLHNIINFCQADTILCHI